MSTKTAKLDAVLQKFWSTDHPLQRRLLIPALKRLTRLVIDGAALLPPGDAASVAAALDAIRAYEQGETAAMLALSRDPGTSDRDRHLARLVLAQKGVDWRYLQDATAPEDGAAFTEES